MQGEGGGRVEGEEQKRSQSKQWEYAPALRVIYNITNLQVSFPSVQLDCSSPMYTTSVVESQGLSRLQSDLVLRTIIIVQDDITVK